VVVDDEASPRRAIECTFIDVVDQVVSFSNGAEALGFLKNTNRADSVVVISDLSMPGMDGLQLLTEIKKDYPDVPVIMVTGNRDVKTAVSLIKAGAFFYLVKPPEPEELVGLYRKAAEPHILRKEILELREKMKGGEVPFFIGKSKAMNDMLALVDKVAKTSFPVLITGENGVGKENIANRIHEMSGERSTGKLVAINCAAIPEALLESELFGCEKGAFTGADKSRTGLIEEANGGTLFIDEIGDMPLSVQIKLLRTLQNKTLRPVGGTQDRALDIRVVSATNKNIEKYIAEGLFREDFFYRIATARIHVPSLKERNEDLVDLAEFLLKKSISLHHGKRNMSFSDSAKKAISFYNWPGNIRQLSSVIDMATVICESADGVISSDALCIPKATRDGRLSCLMPLDEMATAYIKKVLEIVGGNKGVAAHILQIDRKTLNNKVDDGNSSESV
jgi:DNA-binding NtrC family response regulator